MCLAVPGKIVSISGEGMRRTARVSFSGVMKDANLAYVPDAKVGDFVLVHVGFALSILDEAEAARTLQYLGELEEAGRR